MAVGQLVAPSYIDSNPLEWSRASCLNVSSLMRKRRDRKFHKIEKYYKDQCISSIK